MENVTMTEGLYVHLTDDMRRLALRSYKLEQLIIKFAEDLETSTHTKLLGRELRNRLDALEAEYGLQRKESHEAV